MAFPFDTYDFYKTMTDAGMSEQQAKALCQATLKALQEFTAYLLYTQKQNGS